MDKKKIYRIQVRTEIYETYMLRVNNSASEDDDEAMDQVIEVLDKAIKEGKTPHHDEFLSNEEIFLKESFSEFGGFMSIEEESQSGEYIQLLGKKHGN